MTDLVLLRELIKNESARGHNEDLDSVFARCNLDCLFESIIVRAAMPYSPVAIALCYELIGVKTIHACSIAGGSIATFPAWYIERLNALLTLGVSLIRYRAFNNAMSRVNALAARNVNKPLVPGADQFELHN